MVFKSKSTLVHYRGTIVMSALVLNITAEPICRDDFKKDSKEI